MMPLRVRRRPRRRSRYAKVVLLVLAAFVVALLVGGVTQIGRQSGPYDASVNRSFAIQGAVVAQDSNVTAKSVRRLIGVMPTLDRRTLQAELDTFTAQSAAQAAQAEVLTTPTTPGGVQEQFATVFADRAKAVNELRSAIDGLLGMHPLAVAGAPAPTSASENASARAATATPTLLSSTQATDRIAAAGTLLVAADRSYEAARHALARLPGHARLPTSKWTAGADIWQVGAVAAQVDLVATSTTLAVSHRLVLSVVGLTPPALPSPTGVVTPGTSVLPPTSSVTVRVVLSNLGSVDEPHASVQFTLARQPSGAVVKHRRKVAVAAAGAVSLPLISFAVRPGVTYQLTVAIVLPAGQVDTTGTSVSELLEIAPGT